MYFWKTNNIMCNAAHILMKCRSGGGGGGGGGGWRTNNDISVTWAKFYFLKIS